MKKAAYFLLFVFIFSAMVSCSSSQADKKVSEMEDLMDEGRLPLRLDSSRIEHVVNYMGRSADVMTRSASGNLRLLKYRFSDGSYLTFALRPASGGGLVLDHFRAD